MTLETDADDAQQRALNPYTLTALPGCGKEELSRYTVMVYMIGSNLESRLGNATRDMMEMEASGLSYDDVNLLVYAGGSKRWVGNVKAGINGVYDLSREGEDRLVASTEETVNMGDAATLAEFLSFSVQAYPAEHYALILWDHGGGPLWGYGNDELFGGDSLALSELKEAMAASPFGEERKLDFVGFDACLMGSLECMNAWEPYANYYIGSEELEPGDGWNYAFLKTLNETSDPEAIARSVLESFSSYYSEAASEYYQPDVTLSCADLTKLSGVRSALGRLALQMSMELNENRFSRLAQIRLQSKSFGMLEDARGEESFSYDLVDLRDLSDGLMDWFPEECAALTSQLEELIVASYSNIAGSSGVTLYYPARNKSQFLERTDDYEEDAGVIWYQNYLTQLSDAWLDETSRDWDLQDQIRVSERDDVSYELMLTEEQVENAASLSYSLLWGLGDGTYCVVLSDRGLSIDEAGTVSLPEDPNAVFLCTGANRRVPWMVRMVDAQDDREVFQTINTRFNSAISLALHGLEMQTQGVSIQMSAGSGESALTINTVSDADASLYGGKGTIASGEWECVYQSFEHLLPVHDAQGRRKSADFWWGTGVTGFEMIPIEGDFSFAQLPISETNEDWYLQVQLKDTMGECYATDLLPLSPQRAAVTRTQELDAGVLTYTVYADHAEVAEYQGRDTILEIPAEAFGVPVTVIGESAFGKFEMFSSSGYIPVEEVVLPDSVTEIRDSAFFACVDLKTIHLGEGLLRIGMQAFARCDSLEEVFLPESVRTIGRGAFEGCESLQEITLPEGLVSIGKGAFAACRRLCRINAPAQGEAVSMAGDALLSADGTMLLAYPAALTGSCTVPEGVTTIAYGAFENGQLSEVVLPKSLKRIEGYAFFGCRNLQVPAFPEGLEIIGDYAFGDIWYSMEATDEPLQQEEVVFGSALRVIGCGALDGLRAKTFTVSEDNPYYAAFDGCLTNKAGDTLLQFATEGGNAARVPDGITVLDWDSLSFLALLDTFDYDDIHLYLPESVTEIPQEDPDPVMHLTVHTPAGSFGEAFCRLHGISFDHDMESAGEDARETGEWNREEEGDAWEEGSAFSDDAAAVGSDQAVFAADGVTLLSAPVTDGRLIIPEGTEVIGAHAFEDRLDLTEVVFPEGLLEIGDEAFAFCYGLTEITIPDSVTRIGAGAFDNCTGLSSVSFGSGLVMIDREAFWFCESLTDLSLPDSLEEIGEYAFYDVPLTTLTLPEHVTYIGRNAFGKMTYSGWEEDTEDPGQESIASDDQAGDGVMEELTEEEKERLLEIPASVNHLEEEAFSGIPYTGFAVSEENETYASVDGFLTDKAGEILLEAPDHLSGEVRIPNRICAILGPVVKENSQITQVWIPSSVTYIDEGSFAYDLEEQIGEDGEEDYVSVYHFTILCEAGSTAHRYAQEYGIPVMLETTPQQMTLEALTLQEIQGTVETPETQGADAGNMVSNQEGGMLEALNTYQFLHTLLGGMLDYTKVSGWGQENSYQLRWTLTTNGYQIDKTAAALMKNEGYCSEVLRFLKAYLTAEGDDAEREELIVTDAERETSVRGASDWNGILDVLETLSAEESWQAAIQKERATETTESTGSGDAQPGLALEPDADQNSCFSDPSAGFDTFLGVHALEDILSEQISSGEMEAQDRDEEAYLSLLRRMRIAEYTGMMEYYAGAREETYLADQIQRLLALSETNLLEAEELAPLSAGTHAGLGDLFILLEPEEEETETVIEAE